MLENLVSNYPEDQNGYLTIFKYEIVENDDDSHLN